MPTIPLRDRLSRITLSCFGFPLTLREQSKMRSELRHFTPPGQLIDIGSRKMHAIVSGKGSCTVILESGMGGCAVEWCLVQPEVSKFATVVSYDRAGFGWSVQGRKTATCRDYNNDLRRMLQSIGLQPPYVLVGHSFGGMNMQLFASEYPNEVSGLILVDSTHHDRYVPESWNEARRLQYNEALKQYRLGYLLSPLGVPRKKRMHIGTRRLPPDQQQAVTALGYRSNSFQAVYQEFLDSIESGMQLKSMNGLRTDLPVIVISAGKQDDDWKRQQEGLKGLTKNTKQIVVEDSPHAIHIQRPDVIIGAIKKLIDVNGESK
ncbi:alpha/beta hydrolase [Alicyclobacillus fastidiosus]|uniref:Alpha/beta hydrolase n=1 Tax=Alicyclobacillus fastidiosus TaxID=392011 RepID=A0ABY6ZBS8_9BACL|nr:alpha/beta hydrolase [Alicyclobacillus fastidiosus]WAH40292.1 alpha/beta hydrolase [Alicyclobacillus fastidiosus]